MTREEQLDWLYRLKSKIPVYLPAEWGIPMGDALDMAIKALDQEPRWIPVSERLPKPYTYVNATCRSLVDDRANWVVETLYLPIPKENNERVYSDWGDIPMLNWHKAEVVAWMEHKIPEPYKAE